MMRAARICLQPCHHFIIIKGNITVPCGVPFFWLNWMAQACPASQTNSTGVESHPIRVLRSPSKVTIPARAVIPRPTSPTEDLPFTMGSTRGLTSCHPRAVAQEVCIKSVEVKDNKLSHRQQISMIIDCPSSFERVDHFVMKFANPTVANYTSQQPIPKTVNT
jgi:hypothetical protein